MINTKIICALIVVLLCFGFLTNFVYADTFTTEEPFAISFAAGESFVYADLSYPANITFTVVSGSLTGIGSLNATNSGGLLQFIASSSGQLSVSATPETKVALNEIVYAYGYPVGSSNLTLNFVLGQTYNIVWLYYNSVPTQPTPTPYDPNVLPEINMDWLWIFLYSGDFLGFFQAYYLSAFMYVDLLYGVIAMLFFIPLYLRTKSLLLLCIVWLLLGGFFIGVMPVVSALAVLFMALGIGGLLYRLFKPNN